MPAARVLPVSLAAATGSAGAPPAAIDIRRAWKCTISSSDR